MDTPELIPSEWILHYRYAVEEGADLIQAKKIADLMMKELATERLQ